MSTAQVTLFTGLPGNGKTLYCLTLVKQRAEKENRQVYYSGIEILDKQALPWIEIDPLKWHELPPGAIIVLDEAHKIFPVRPTGSKVPDHVLPIAELRHDGLDMYLITQHPMELDSSVRRRIGRHFQLERRFGYERSAIYEWTRGVKENCDKSKKDAILHEWAFNKEAYGWYKSAEIHTIKGKLPARLLWLVVMVVMIPFAIWFVWHQFVGKRSDSAVPGPDASASAVAPARRASGVVAGDYFSNIRPRVAGLPHTAPVYDDVTRPVRAPYPAACVESASRCQCYTQQGTRLDTTIEICHGIAVGGFFVAWDEGRGRDNRSEAVNVRPVAPAAPVYPGQGLGGFNTTHVVSAEPVSAVMPEQASGRGRAIAR